MTFQERIKLLRAAEKDIENIVSAAAAEMIKRTMPLYPKFHSPIAENYWNSTILDEDIEITFVNDIDSTESILVPFQAFNDIDLWITEQLEAHTAIVLKETNRRSIEEHRKLASRRESELATLKMLREKYPND